MVAQILQVQHPLFAGSASRAGVKYPRTVSVSTQALFPMLSHTVRKEPDPRGIIGTLLGTRSEDGLIIEVKAAYIIPLTEDDSEVTIHTDYHSEMYFLLKRAHPEYQVVGWYSTSPEIDSMTGIIHDFYGRENGTFPYPPIHLTLDPSQPGIALEAFVSSPIFASPSNEIDGNGIFTPIETEVKFTETDQPLINSSAEEFENFITHGVAQTIEEAIENVLAQIEDVKIKVKEARASGQNAASDELARYLFRVLASSPTLEAPNTQVPPKLAQSGVKFDARSAMYNAYMRDIVMIVNLAESIKRQVEVASMVSQQVNSETKAN